MYQQQHLVMPQVHHTQLNFGQEPQTQHQTTTGYYQVQTVAVDGCLDLTMGLLMVQVLLDQKIVLV